MPYRMVLAKPVSPNQHLAGVRSVQAPVTETALDLSPSSDLWVIITVFLIPGLCL